MQRFLLCLACFLSPVSCLLSKAEPLTPSRVTALRAKIRENFFIPAVLPPPAAATHRTFAAAPGVKAEALTDTLPGGLRAIGAGVPDYRREELDVFTPEEWETRKEKLTFAAWVAAVRK